MDWNVWERLQLWPIKQQKRKLKRFYFDFSVVKKDYVTAELVFLLSFAKYSP